MRILRYVTIVSIAAAAVAGGAFFARAGAKDDQPAPFPPFVIPLEMTPTWREILPMHSDTIAREARDGAPSTAIKVRLQLTHYRQQAIEGREGRVWENPVSNVKCYELVSDAAYTWAHFVIPPWPMAGFALFNLPGGTSYLCWASHFRVQMADVTRSRDRIVAFQDYCDGKQPAGPPEANVLDLVPGGKEWGGTPLQFPDTVRILDLKGDGEGRLVLTVKDTKSPSAAVLGLRDGVWVLLHDYPEGLPEATPAGTSSTDPAVGSGAVTAPDR